MSRRILQAGASSTPCKEITVGLPQHGSGQKSRERVIGSVEWNISAVNRALDYEGTNDLRAGPADRDHLTIHHVHEHPSTVSRLCACQVVEVHDGEAMANAISLFHIAAPVTFRRPALEFGLDGLPSRTVQSSHHIFKAISGSFG